MSHGLPLSEQRPALRYEAGDCQPVEESVATEYALTIYVNDQEMATVVCSPEHMDDLVLGFLASEGIVRSVDQVNDLVVNSRTGTARVHTTNLVNFNQAFFNKRYIGSCCGKGRQSFYFYNDAHTARWVGDDVTLDPPTVLQLVDRMDAMADLFHQTGGVHMACLADIEGNVMARTDIGRHNALDKLHGYCLRHHISRTGRVVTFSGRVSSEVLLKVAKMGIGIVLARSAPTSLALDIAQELNITVVGFVRNGTFNIYTHPWRIR
ncbi:formate dehydrogenase accessory sulfurtransferase FdhD [Alicyclobacillus shizuokensis]|uniref:formate dehydrogenase accessory sulfurtransferase FdhD n=1 Tax=Alicyclobacillus shizuokensis TaxID=392014 RepID=UPI000A928E99|nr:formate dehydrogenase accessory sulfurtransferase FdhD [Alicyclobacillus shizuokensis]